MDLKGILSIAGQGGLFKMISQGKNAVIVEHLDTGNRMPAYATARISSLEDISIYTEEDEIPLAEVLKRIKEKESDQEILNPKKLSSNEIKAYFEEIVPEYDQDRVYVSDMKKVINWYNSLLKHGILDKEPEPVEEKETKTETMTETKTETKNKPKAEAKTKTVTKAPKEKKEEKK